MQIKIVILQLLTRLVVFSEGRYFILRHFLRNYLAAMW